MAVVFVGTEEITQRCKKLLLALSSCQQSGPEDWRKAIGSCLQEMQNGLSPGGVELLSSLCSAHEKLESGVYKE